MRDKSNKALWLSVFACLLTMNYSPGRFDGGFGPAQANRASAASLHQSSRAVSGQEKSVSSKVTKRLVPEVWSVPAGDVALTFDDGPTAFTEQIIQVLEKYHVRATFFFVGARVAARPNVVRDAVAHGDAVGNHTVTHSLMTKLTKSEQNWQIVTASRQISAYDPNPITLFRPPYEGMNDLTEQVLANHHMVLALWNRDPRDWAAQSAQEVVRAVLSNHPSGGVFDLHDRQLTLQALPFIIEGLQKQGLHFVVLRAPGQKTATPSGAAVATIYAGRGWVNH